MQICAVPHGSGTKPCLTFKGLLNGDYRMNNDRQTQQDVMNELRADPTVNAAHIGITVNNNIVTLSGHVANFFEKWNVENAAQRVKGVQGISIEIDVSLPKDRERTDEDIARTVQSLLGWSSAIPGDSIKVMVENGWVTLRGEVDWKYQRDIAHQVVAGLIGVKGVTDNIALKTVGLSEKIKEQIDESLKRLSVIDANKISVKVSGNQVTLEGSIGSMLERDLIRRAAWTTQGVHFLIDRMKFVSPKENRFVRGTIF